MRMKHTNLNLVTRYIAKLAEPSDLAGEACGADEGVSR
jgi:hypothetical protein